MVVCAGLAMIVGIGATTRTEADGVGELPE